MKITVEVPIAFRRNLSETDKPLTKVQAKKVIEEMLDLRAHTLIDANTIKDFLRTLKTVLWFDWDITDEEDLDLAASAFCTLIENLNEFVKERHQNG